MRGIAFLITIGLLSAGCLGGDDAAPIGADDAPVAAVATHILANAVEPEGLDAPTFSLLGAIAQGGPVYGAGEPSIWAHLDGTVYLAFPGCDAPGVPLFGSPLDRQCAHGPVYKSTDAGASWERLNDEATGRLSEDGPAANGDNDVAVDAGGSVYSSDLGGGIQVFRSDDAGATWAHAGNVVPEDHWADRQWMAAAHAGHLIMTWMGGEGSQRAVAVSTTWDGGETWTDVEYLGEDIGWLGTVQFDPTGTSAYIPFTQVEASNAIDPLGIAGSSTFALLVARTLDGGATWEIVDTGARVTSSATGLHWSGVLMAPALDVTGDGTVVYVWSEEVLDASGVTTTGALVNLVASTDGGLTWTAPFAVSERASSIMPWVTGGAGDRIAITYFASDVPLDSDYFGMTWDVMASYVDGVATSPTVAHSLIEANVHQGGLCARGGLCLLTGSDRALLDFFESDLLPDGRLILTYPADPLTGGKLIDIRVAVQEGGALLAMPAPS